MQNELIVSAGQRIGLLGGSFDPPHAGHLHLSRRALAAFALDRIWWMVSPQNPLKSQKPAPFADRLNACRALVQDPRIVVTDWEARLNSPYTIDSLTALRIRHNAARFVLLMGADSFAGLHKWRDWQGICRAMPIGVIARPAHQLSASTGPVARRFAHARLPAHLSQSLPYRPAPAWCLSVGAMDGQSSTRLRVNDER